MIAHLRTIETDNFRITLDAVRPTLSIPEQFDDTTHDVEEIESDIRRGNLVHFDARCTVMHKPTGTEVGADYLCGCVYESFQRFVECRGYANDMIRESIGRARETLDKLAQAA